MIRISYTVRIRTYTNSKCFKVSQISLLLATLTLSTRYCISNFTFTDYYNEESNKKISRKDVPFFITIRTRRVLFISTMIMK